MDQTQTNTGEQTGRTSFAYGVQLPSGWLILQINVVIAEDGQMTFECNLNGTDLSGDVICPKKQ